ncbi:MAG TPA: dihydrolipoyl dehydrogenase [Virgibacillus sp.]|nr:dihydrolipoyl dehydrogenase [Virgibacillus sp.]
MKKYDLVVLGGGPGGYVAAEHASSKGYSVALVEARELGGTCLNRGCIPSKTLLRYAEVIELINRSKEWGITVDNVHVSFEKMKERKNQVIQQLQFGVQGLLRNANVSVYKGLGKVHPDHRITIATNNKEETIYGEKIIIATGSKPNIPPIKGIDQVDVHTSDTIFDLESIPESLVIVGGGVIGVEIASVFANLNCSVTLVEASNQLMPGIDPDASSLLLKKLQSESNVSVFTSANVLKITEEVEEKVVELKNEQGETLQVTAEEVLVATGRIPNIQGLEELNLEYDRNFIAVNSQMETSIPSIYAIGDVIGREQLAHVASSEGIVAASNAIRQFKEVNYAAVPHCVYTSPEIASVGMSKEEAEQKGYEVKVSMFPYSHSGKATTMGEQNGFIKLIASKACEKILGVVIVGPNATEMIAESCTLITLDAKVDDIINTMHPHPTLAEGMYEVAKMWQNP